MTPRRADVRLDAARLRLLFNELQIWERRVANELLETVISDTEPRPENKQPPGTRSITSQICEMNGLRRTVVAVVHYYRLPDGTINNRAGAPDPKFLVHDGVRYVLG